MSSFTAGPKIRSMHGSRIETEVEGEEEAEIKSGSNSEADGDSGGGCLFIPTQKRCCLSSSLLEQPSSLFNTVRCVSGSLTNPDTIGVVADNIAGKMVILGLISFLTITYYIFD